MSITLGNTAGRTSTTGGPHGPAGTGSARSGGATAPHGTRLAPALPGGLPFLGHAIPFKLHPITLLRQAQKRFGEMFRFKLAGHWVHFLCSPQAHEAYFMAPEDQLSQREVYQFMTPIFGKGIVYDVPIELMMEQVGFLRPALREERLRMYARSMVEETERYIEGWGDEGVIDIVEAATELTIFISGRCLFGPEFRKYLTTEFAELYHDLEAAINILAFYAPQLPLPVFRRRDRARARMTDLISRIVHDRRARGIREEDFLQTLMEARYADGRALTDDEITGLVITVLFAGHHTSAVLAAWTGIELSRHPQYTARVIGEQRKVFGSLPNPGAINYETLKQLSLLDNAAREAGRLHPPLVMLMRKVLRDFHYGDYVVPAGDLAMVAPDVSHRLASVFSDPDRFDPDRFGPGREEDKTHLFNIVMFGGGRHRCIGSVFAFQQVRALFSVILQNYELELVSDTVVPNYDGFVVGPRQPCLVRYRRRRWLWN